MIRHQIENMNPASLYGIEENCAEEPKSFGIMMGLLRSPALPNAQKILVKATAKPPVIEHSNIDIAMKIIEGRKRQEKGHRFLEWPFQVLNSLNLQRYDQRIKLRDSDIESQSSDTDENGEDSDGDDEEQGADANIMLDSAMSPGKIKVGNLD